MKSQYTRKGLMMFTERDSFIGRTLVLGCVLSLVVFGVTAQAAENPVGEWTVVTDAGGQENTSTVTITEADGSYSGSIATDQGVLELEGISFEEGELKFDMTVDAQGQQMAFSFSGKISGDKMDVTWGSEFGDFPGEATRGDGADPNGEWTVVTDAGGQETTSVINVSLADGAVTGTITGDEGTAPLVNPGFEGNTLTFDITIDAQGQELELKFSGAITGDSMDVSWGSEFGDFPGVGTRGGAADPNGEWTVVTDAGGQETTSVINVSLADGAVSGTITGDAGTSPLVNPGFEGKTLTFDLTIDGQGQELELKFSGVIDGDTMDVIWGSEFGDFPGVGTRGGAGDPIGEWLVVTDAAGDVTESTLTISKSGDTYAGTIGSDEGVLNIEEVTFDDGVLKFDITIDAEGTPLDLAFSATIDGDTMTVNWGSDFGDFPGEGTRQ
jgi:hypothetical protein